MTVCPHNLILFKISSVCTVVVAELVTVLKFLFHTINDVPDCYINLVTTLFSVPNLNIGLALVSTPDAKESNA